MYDKIVQLLEASAVSFTMHEHETIHTVQEAQEQAPDWVEQLIKTVAFQMKEGTFVLVAVCGHSRIDYRKLAAVVGVNRRDVRSLSPSEVASYLGVPVGGVGPFPLWEDSRVIFDRQTQTLGTIYCGTGCPTRTLEIAIEDLVQVVSGVVADIVKE